MECIFQFGSGRFREIWGNHSGAGSEVDIDPQGNVYQHAAGHNLTKFSGKDGTILWRRLFTGHTIYALDNNGDAFFADGTNIVKVLGSNDEIVWEKRYSRDSRYRLWKMGINSDAVFVLGSARTNDVVSRHLSKVSKLEGTILWEKQIDVTILPDAMAETAIAPNGDVILFYTAETNITALKLSGETGEVLWSRTHAETNKFFDLCGTAVAGNGDIAVIGTGIVASPENYIGYTALLDGSNGELRWAKWNGLWDGHSNEYPYNVCIAPDGAVITAAREFSYLNSQYYYVDCLVKSDGETGRQLWEYKTDPVGPLIAPTPSGLLFDSTGELYYGTESVGPTSAHLLKINSGSGELIWQRPFTNMDSFGFDLQGDFLVIAGSGWQQDTSVRAFRFGPELTTRVTGSGEIEIEWAHEQLGWKLQKLVGESFESSEGQPEGTVHQWETVMGSQETNFVRMNLNESAGVFRLSKE